MKKLNLRKSFAAVMMAFVMLLSVLPTAAFAAETPAALEEGSYTVPVTSLISAAPLQPVQDAFANAFGESIQVDVDAQGKMTATIVPQHMVVDMSAMNMGSYHCNILTVEGATYPEMKTELVTPTFGSAATQEIQCPAKVVVDLPEANEDGSYTLTLTVDFMNSFLGGGLENSYPTDVTLTLDWANAKPIVKIADGNYYVNAYLWHEKKDQPSMGDTAMEANRQVLVTVADGVVTNVQVATAPVTMQTITSAITDIKVNGQEVEILKKAPFTTKPEGNDYEYIQLFQFTLPAEAQPSELAGTTYIPIQFIVPDTPMGNGFMDARIKLDWASATATEDTQIALPEPQPEKADVDLMDKATGVKIHAPAGTFAEEVTLVVEKIAAGDAYENAAAVVESVGEKFDLYAIRFVSADGEEVKAMGPVTISVPVSDDFDADALVMYRVNADGTKTLVRGQVEDGCFVFLQKTFGTYALVEEGSVIEEGTNPGKPENKPEVKPEKPEAKPEKPDEKPGTPTAPETGDSTQLVLLTVAALAAAAGAAFVVSAKRRNEN